MVSPYYFGREGMEKGGQVRGEVGEGKLYGRGYFRGGGVKRMGGEGEC